MGPKKSLTEMATSRPQLKSIIFSVMPSGPGTSFSAEGGGIYLYSFFNTRSEKNWFSLKYCTNPFRFHKTNRKKAYKFDREASVLLSVFFDPDIFKVAQCGLVRIMLSVISHKSVIRHCNRPEIRNSLCDFTALLIYRTQCSLSLALYEPVLQSVPFTVTTAS